jgi:hypothetical protein
MAEDKEEDKRQADYGEKEQSKRETRQHKRKNEE